MKNTENFIGCQTAPGLPAWDAVGESLQQGLGLYGHHHVIPPRLYTARPGPTKAAAFFAAREGAGEGGVLGRRRYAQQSRIQYARQAPPARDTTLTSRDTACLS